jgi:hypothetical protein
MRLEAAVKLQKLVAEGLGGGRLEVKGNLLFQKPIQDVLCGLCLESSGFSASAFYPNIFVQPMYEKASCLVFSIGERFRGNWQLEDDGIVEKLIRQMRSIGLLFWNTFGTAQKLASLPLDPPDLRRLVTAGYSLVICNRSAEAERVLRAADKRLRETYADQMRADPSFWGNAVRAEIREMLGDLREPKSAITRLKAWRQFTLEALGLSAYAE